MSKRLRKVSLREIYKCPVVDDENNEIGFIDDVLFHPTEPRAIGYSVRPTAGWEGILLSYKYLALDMTSVTDDGEISVTINRKAWGKQAEKYLGYKWDDSIIWYGQHVHTESGQHLGKISDALFSLETGEIGGIEITDGTITDLSLGKRTVPAEMVNRFKLEELHAIVVADEAADCPYAGGLAVRAGKQVAQAKENAKESTKATIVGAGHAVGHIERIIKENLAFEYEDDDDERDETKKPSKKAKPAEGAKPAKSVARKAGGLLGSMGSMFKDMKDEYNKSLEED